MPNVWWTEKAEKSVLAIGRYIIEHAQSRQRGIDVVARIEEKCARYATFPLSGTSREDIGPGLRCFPVDNLIVIYRPFEDGMVVMLVAHGHQDIQTIVRQMFGDEAEDPT